MYMWDAGQDIRVGRYFVSRDAKMREESELVEARWQTVYFVVCEAQKG